MYRLHLMTYNENVGAACLLLSMPNELLFCEFPEKAMPTEFRLAMLQVSIKC